MSDLEMVDGIRSKEVKIRRVGNIIILDESEKGESLMIFPDYIENNKSCLVKVLQNHGIEVRMMTVYDACDFVDGGILAVTPIPVEKVPELENISSELFMAIKKSCKKGNISGKVLSQYIDAYEEDIRENGFIF